MDCSTVPIIANPIILIYYYEYVDSMNPFPAAETVKPEQDDYSQDFLCIDNATTDSSVSPAFSPALSLSSDDTLFDNLAPLESIQLMTPLQQKLPDQSVEIRLDDLLDWNGEQTFTA
jgi:hypothetical protein